MQWVGRTLIIDNLDSFTWNLAHQLEGLGDDPIVLRCNDPILQNLAVSKPRRLIISPGPGTPEAATESRLALATCLDEIPILGVCLGHQCLAHHYGTATKRLSFPTHGKQALVDHNGEGLFAGLPNPIRVMRYHSLAIDTPRSPLQETAWLYGDKETVVMAIQHKTKPVAGVQFHPESFLTEHGQQIMENFLQWV